MKGEPCLAASVQFHHKEAVLSFVFFNSCSNRFNRGTGKTWPDKQQFIIYKRCYDTKFEYPMFSFYQVKKKIPKVERTVGFKSRRTQKASSLTYITPNKQHQIYIWMSDFKPNHIHIFVCFNFPNKTNLFIFVMSLKSQLWSDSLIAMDSVWKLTVQPKCYTT